MSVELLSVKAQSGQELLSFLEAALIYAVKQWQKKKKKKKWYVLNIMNKTVVVQKKQTIEAKFFLFFFHTLVTIKNETKWRNIP